MSKGSSRRPCQVPREQEEAAWERVFGKKKLNVMSDEDRGMMSLKEILRVTASDGVHDDRDRETGGDVPADGHDSQDLHGAGVPIVAGGDEIPERVPFWIKPEPWGEYYCPHGVGHGNHVHGCDGCCARTDFPLNRRA